MASAAHVREKPIDHQNQQQQHQQQRQPVLKCPRCDSSNTKFCYYNNYSLSQPRHFCKACKRYWTRGGTLRNVPVGGGCRKNKRSIKPTLSKTVGHNPNPNLDHSSQLLTNSNPLCGLLQQNHKYQRFNNGVSDISNTDISMYDLVHPQLTSSGLGFTLSDAAGVTSVANHSNNSVPIVSSYPSLLSSGPTSGLQQPQSFLGFAPYGDGGDSVVNDVQMDMTKSNAIWSNSFNGQNDNDQIKGVDSSDPTSFLWTITGGDWLDPTSTSCSPVPSLL